MLTAEQLVGCLLEEEPLDWEPDPADPDDAVREPTDAVAHIIGAEKRRVEVTHWLNRAFRGSFMQPEVHEDEPYYVAETNRGDSFVVPAMVHNPGEVPPNPDDYIPDGLSDIERDAYLESDEYTERAAEYNRFLDGFNEYRTEGTSGEVESVELKRGVVYRTQAPGYMDTTDWQVADTYEEACNDLIQYYGDDERREDDEDEEQP